MKRTLVAVILISIMLTTIALLTLFTFAVPQNGDQCTTDYVDALIGSDGAYFYRNGVQSSIKYYPDGSTGVFSHRNYDGPRQHYLIMPDGDDSYYGYCIEQGESFPDAQRYSGEGWRNDSYFSKLPSPIQTGIMLATIFGWQPGKNVPVAGCNQDDWYWATQVIIWEYQQRLRSSPTMIQGNGYVSSNYFQSTLAGRPAERCYYYILESMAKYQAIPSFAAMDSINAPLSILKWDSSKQRWCITVNDTNQIEYPLISEESKLVIERHGNQYTFCSTERLNLETVKLKKDVPLPSHEMLIWGGANTTQAISTGAADPVYFFAQFRTEEPGVIEIVKTSEDDEKTGIQFSILDQNGQSTHLQTNKDGVVSAQLYPGQYSVTEEPTIQYRTLETVSVEVKENQTTHLEIKNILKKGQIRIQKNVVDSIADRIIAEKGAVFQVYSADFSSFDGTPQNQRDVLETDDLGIAISKELPLGDYIVHQKAAGKNIAFSSDRFIAIESDLQLVQLAVENHFQKGKIRIRKNDNTKLPLAGAVFTIKAAEDIQQSDGTTKYPKGSLLNTLVTDDEGIANSDWLYPGMYDLEEIEAPTGYVISANPVKTVMLTSENWNETTFMKSVVIENNQLEEYPNTGDKIRRTSTRTTVILMIISLIGIGVLSYMMQVQNKTPHLPFKKPKRS